MSKRILIVCQHFWPESFRVNDIADFMIEKGYEVEVLCGIPNYPHGEFYKGFGFFKNRNQIHKNIKIRRVFEIPRGNNSNLRIFLNYISFPIASIFHLPRLLVRDYDKIFLYQLSPVMMSLAGIFLGKLKRTETTMYVLDLWPENLYSVLDIKNSVLRKLAKTVSHWHYRHVDKLIVLSKAMKIRLAEITEIKNEKILVLPQTSEKIYETNSSDSTLQIKFKHGFNILYAGNISPAQSFETIINAALQLETKGIHDINWIIVGDGMSRKEIEAQVLRAGLSQKFYFEGFKPIEEIPNYTNIADLLIGCLVKSELLEATIPAKVMSYIASGKPLALAMDGEVRELINNIIRCGLASPAGDSNQLALNIEKIYSLPAIERKKMGERGRAYHFKHFERNIVLSKLDHFIFD